MFTYIVRRILILIPMMLVISFLVYGGIELMPGDAVDFMVPPDQLADISPEDLELLRESLGLNDPFLVRYFNWLGDALTGDFGYSLASGLPTTQLVLAKLPRTLELAIAALFISTILGSALGVFSARKNGSLTDNLLTVTGMIGVSIPQFFFGMILILAVFKFELPIPINGKLLSGNENLFEHLMFLLPPAIVLGISLTAGVMRYSRSSMLSSMNKDFIKTARSKGLPEWRVNLLHGLRVAMTPVVILVGFRIPILFGGSVIIESVFQWPGIGSLFIDSVISQNTPIVMTVALFTVFLVLVASFLVDVITALIDPRVKLGR